MHDKEKGERGFKQKGDVDGNKCESDLFWRRMNASKCVFNM